MQLEEDTKYLFKYIIKIIGNQTMTNESINKVRLHILYYIYWNLGQDQLSISTEILKRHRELESSIMLYSFNSTTPNIETIMAAIANEANSQSTRLDNIQRNLDNIYRDITQTHRKIRIRFWHGTTGIKRAILLYALTLYSKQNEMDNLLYNYLQGQLNQNIELPIRVVQTLSGGNNRRSSLKSFVALGVNATMDRTRNKYGSTLMNSFNDNIRSRAIDVSLVDAFRDINNRLMSSLSSDLSVDDPYFNFVQCRWIRRKYNVYDIGFIYERNSLEVIKSCRLVDLQDIVKMLFYADLFSLHHHIDYLFRRLKTDPTNTIIKNHLTSENRNLQTRYKFYRRLFKQKLMVYSKLNDFLTCIYEIAEADRVNLTQPEVP
jgi:hypothetical protein